MMQLFNYRKSVGKHKPKTNQTVGESFTVCVYVFEKEKHLVYIQKVQILTIGNELAILSAVKDREF